MAFLAASNVPLLDQLKDPLSGINKKAQANLQDILGQLGTQATTSAKASGRTTGSYAPAELARVGTNASNTIQDTLLGALGGTSYDELLKQKEQERNLALARRIGDLSAPSLLQQILGGLGSGAQTGAQFYSLFHALKKPGLEYGGGSGRLPPSLSLIPGGGY